MTIFTKDEMADAIAVASTKPAPESDDSDEKTQQDDLVAGEKKSFKFLVTVFMVCFISIAVSMDSVIVAAVLESIATSLEGSSLEAFWVGTSYLLTQTVVIPLYGTVSEIFGRKPVMLFAIALFLLGSILCGCAQNMNWLIAARSVQGLGGGGCLSLTAVILSDITSLRERPKYLALGAFAWALGTNIGVPVGGALGEFSTWRWAFWLNIPICVVSFAGIVYALHLVQDKSSFYTKLARVDYLGMAVFVAATTLMLYGITTGGVSNPWNSASTLVPLVLGVVGIGLFIIVQWKVSKEPMLPLTIFSDRSGNTGFFGAVIHGLALWAFAYYIIIFFLGARGSALFKASAETLPGSAPVAISAVFCGIWVGKTKRIQKMTWLAWVLLTAGVGLTALMKPDSSPGILYAMRIIPAVGGGWLFQLPLFAAQVTVRSDDVGIATSAIAFFRSIGQAFGVAIGGTVFQNEFDRLITKQIANGSIMPAYVVTGGQAASAYSVIASFPEEVQVIYRYIYADALATLWYVLAGICVSALIVSFLLRDVHIDGGNDSKQRFRDDKALRRDETV